MKHQFSLEDTWTGSYAGRGAGMGGMQGRRAAARWGGGKDAGTAGREKGGSRGAGLGRACASEGCRGLWASSPGALNRTSTLFSPARHSLVPSHPQSLMRSSSRHSQAPFTRPGLAWPCRVYNIGGNGPSAVSHSCAVGQLVVGLNVSNAAGCLWALACTSTCCAVLCALCWAAL